MLAKLALQAVVLLALGFALMLRTPEVTGRSMEPQLHSGDYLLLNTLTYRLHAPHRDDIIAFLHHRDDAELYVKRVIGLPGETVCVRHGVVSVNGSALAEPYVRFPDTKDAPCVAVPPQAYYVLGDNRAVSDDSRDWGVVASSEIVGRAQFILWPLDRVGEL